ncbi:hypothetical protein [Legionella sp. W05-934-2]|uniref:hypothetical protein n=1 Tax=Legionella sp. W05-934-2 TaxID=1198649 RepID=UPI003462A7D4
MSNGGNVVGSRHDQLIRQDNGLSLLNVSGYPKREPKRASEAYANCVYHLLTEIMSPDGTVDFDNKWVQEIWVTHNKQTNNKIYNEYIT